MKRSTLKAVGFGVLWFGGAVLADVIGMAAGFGSAFASLIAGFVALCGVVSVAHYVSYGTNF